MWTPLIFVNLIRVISFTSSWKFTWFVIFLFWEFCEMFVSSSVICVQCYVSPSEWNEEQQECHWKFMISSHHSMETPLTYTYSESFQGVMWRVMVWIFLKLWCELLDFLWISFVSFLLPHPDWFTRFVIFLFVNSVICLFSVLWFMCSNV